MNTLIPNNIIIRSLGASKHVGSKIDKIDSKKGVVQKYSVEFENEISELISIPYKKDNHVYQKVKLVDDSIDTYIIHSFDSIKTSNNYHVFQPKLV